MALILAVPERAGRVPSCLGTPCPQEPQEPHVALRALFLAAAALAGAKA